MKLGVPLLRYSSALGLGGLVWLVASVIAFTPPPTAVHQQPAHPWQPLPPAVVAVPAGASEVPRPAREPHPDAERFRPAAELAFTQFRRLWQEETGLANATPDYNKLTSWDIGSVLGAVYSARILELISAEEYEEMMGTTLRTVNELPLYRGVAYHKLYSSTTGRMVSRGGGYTTRGYGWSATDLGRLLLWLHIVARNDPAHAELASNAARRVAFDSIVAGGYVYGEERGRRGRRRFQEGRIGYEQYIAAGFAAWGADVARALDVRTNATPVEVAGVQLLADRRGLDRIVSEPFVLMGLEVGWDPQMRELALAVLQAQENHSSATGTLSIGSEDAIGIPPFYFYYYCVYCSGEAFVVESANPGSALDVPRWLSTKMAFGWHAVAPNAFTGEAVGLAENARSPRGWSSGIFLESRKATRTLDINTAAVILEAAAYVQLGRPLIEWRSGAAQSSLEAP